MLTVNKGYLSIQNKAIIIREEQSSSSWKGLNKHDGKGIETQHKWKAVGNKALSGFK